MIHGASSSHAHASIAARFARQDELQAQDRGASTTDAAADEAQGAAPAVDAQGRPVNSLGGLLGGVLNVVGNTVKGAVDTVEDTTDKATGRHKVDEAEYSAAASQNVAQTDLGYLQSRIAEATADPRTSSARIGVAHDPYSAEPRHNRDEISGDFQRGSRTLDGVAGE